MPVLEQPTVWPNPVIVALPSTSAILQNATDWAATYFRAPKTGNITGVSLYTATVTTGCTVVGTLETPDGTYPNAPSGALVHANATGTVAIANSDDSVVKRINFAGNVPVTKNDPMWVKVAVSSGTPSSLPLRCMTSMSGPMEPYSLKRESSVESYSALALAVVFHYDDGDEVVQSVLPGQGLSWNVSTTTNPREVGAKFRVPWSARSDGALVRFSTVTATADADVILYDADDNVLATVSFDGDNFGGSGSLNGQRWVPWPTAVEMQKGAWYRLVLKSQSASTWSQGPTGLLPIAEVPAASIAWLADFHLTYRGPSGGAWTDFTDRFFHGVVSFDRLYLPDQSHQF